MSETPRAEDIIARLAEQSIKVHVHGGVVLCTTRNTAMVEWLKGLGAGALWFESELWSRPTERDACEVRLNPIVVTPEPKPVLGETEEERRRRWMDENRAYWLEAARAEIRRRAA
jgi:hypothetical protein